MLSRIRVKFRFEWNHLRKIRAGNFIFFLVLGIRGFWSNRELNLTRRRSCEDFCISDRPATKIIKLIEALIN